MEKKNMDYLKFSHNRAILDLLEPNDSIIFSCKLIKINHRGRNQERFMLITKKYIHNIKKKKLRRKTLINDICAITKSSIKKNNQFVIHVSGDHDYYYESNMRDIIMKVLNEQYFNIRKKNITIYSVPEMKLKNYVVTSHKKVENLDKLPDNKYKLENPEFNLSLIAPNTNEDVSVDFFKSTLIYLANPEMEYLPSDFNIIQQLSKFENESKYYILNTVTNESYILKVIQGNSLLSIDEVTAESITKEASINIGNPFVLQLDYAYKTPTSLYIIHSYNEVTNLDEELKKQKRMNERKARFYGFQIALGLNHIHSKGMIYGILSPENVLIGSDNYVCLDDFGTYRFMSLANKSLYLSSIIQTHPEIQQFIPIEYFFRKESTLAGDRWKFGILMYKLSIGVTSFYTANMKAYEEIVKSRPLKFPISLEFFILLSESVKNLLRDLLNKDEKERLKESAVNHEFFKKDIWTKEELMKKEIDKKYLFLTENKNSLNQIPIEAITYMYPPEDEIIRIIEKFD